MLAPMHGKVLDPSNVAIAIKVINEALPNYEWIRDWLILKYPLTESSGLLTRSGKPRRAAIEIHYAAELRALYE